MIVERQLLWLSVLAIAASVLYLLKGDSALLISGFGLKSFPTISTARHPRQCHFAYTSLYLQRLPKTQIINESIDAANRLEAARPSHNEPPTVVLFLSDSKYQIRFEEMIRTWSHFVDKSSLVMIALDEETDTFFRSRGVKTVRMFPETLDTESSIREAVLRAKVEVPYLFLLKGLRVVVVEMDIYCRFNPLQLDNGTADVLVAEHNYSDEVNVGFWITYPACSVVDSFRRMHTWVTDPNRTNAYCDGAFDQKLLHFAWLGDGPLSSDSSSSCRTFSQRDQIFDQRVNKRVLLRRISFQDVMHWVPLADPETWPGNPDTSCVHIWSGFGPPDAQIKYGYRRKWFPMVSEREAGIALGKLHMLGKD